MRSVVVVMSGCEEHGDGGFFWGGVRLGRGETFGDSGLWVSNWVAVGNQ